MGANPTPASFEKTALRIPIITNPQKPPVTAVLRLKASSKISAKACGTLERLKSIIISTDTKYKTTIKGTIVEATLEIFFKPPKMTTEVTTDNTRPMMVFQTNSEASKIDSPGTITSIRVW